MEKKIEIMGNKVIRNDFINDTRYIQFIIIIVNKVTKENFISTIGKADATDLSTYGNGKGDSWKECLHSVFSMVKNRRWKYNDVKIQMVEYSNEKWEKSLAWCNGVTIEELRKQREEETWF